MFFDQLKKICHERGTSPSAAAVAIGLSKSAVTRWGDGQDPTFGDVIKLADLLNVDIREFAGEPIADEKNPAAVFSDGLNKFEIELIHLVRKMTEEQKSVYFAALEAGLKSQGLI